MNCHGNCAVCKFELVYWIWVVCVCGGWAGGSYLGLGPVVAGSGCAYCRAAPFSVWQGQSWDWAGLAAVAKDPQSRLWCCASCVLGLGQSWDWNFAGIGSSNPNPPVPDPKASRASRPTQLVRSLLG